MLSLVQAAELGKVEMVQLVTFVPSQIQRGHLTFADAKVLGSVFGFDPWALGKAAELSENSTSLAADDGEKSLSVGVKIAFSLMLVRGYPTISDISLVAGVFGIAPLSDVPKPPVSSVLSLSGAVGAQLPKARLPCTQAILLELLVPGILERGYPKYSAVSSHVEILGVNFEFPRLLIFRCLQFLQAPDRVISLSRKADLAISEVSSCQDRLLEFECGYPGLSDIQLLVSAFKVNLQDDIWRLIVDTLMAQLPDGLVVTFTATKV